MSEQERGSSIIVKILIAAVLMVMLAALPVSGQDRPHAKTSGMDALGEFLRGMKTLADVKKALPGGDPFLERVRTKYEIPERIDIFAPRGGSEVIVLAFDDVPVVAVEWKKAARVGAQAQDQVGIGQGQALHPVGVGDLDLR